MRALAIGMSLLLAGTGVAFGQVGGAQGDGIDLSGNWVANNSVDANMDQPGSEPQLGDYMGVPVNDDARAAGEAYNPDSMGEPERECAYYPVTYVLLGPLGIRLSNIIEPFDGSTLAWRIAGWEDLAPITIWLSGHAQPSKYAAHELTGYTTGAWQNDILKSVTTHMRYGIIRRNGTPSSDRATLTMWFLRHTTELTIFGMVDDPVYLTEPYVLTRDFSSYVGPTFQGSGAPCVITNEGAPEGIHPFFLRGHNPFLSPDRTATTYGLPVDAVRGGAKTMYPEYRKTLKGSYKRPAQCPTAIASNPERVCGGVGKYPRRAL